MARRKMLNPAKRLPVHNRHVIDIIGEEQLKKELIDIHEQIMLRMSTAEGGLRHGTPPGKVGR